MWRLVPVLKLALMLTWAQMGSWQGAGPVVAVFPEMPFFRVNSAAPSVHSPPVAGKTSHFVFSHSFSFLFRLFLVRYFVTSQVFLFF